MPFLIIVSEEGGMSHEYVVGPRAFIKSVKSHKYCTDKDIEIAKKFIETSQIGDFYEYPKGMFVRVNLNEK